MKLDKLVDLPIQIVASLFAPLMFVGLHNQFPLLTMMAVYQQIALSLCKHDTV